MKCSKSAIIGFVMLLLISVPGCSSIPKNAPTLELILMAEKSSEQRVQAIQLTTSWTDGSGRGYEADSLHPLSLESDRFNETTLRLADQKSEVELLFSDKYQPQTISAYRWNAVFLNSGGDISDEVLERSEPVEIENNTIIIYDDGFDYIYEIYASWSNGSSWWF